MFAKSSSYKREGRRIGLCLTGELEKFGDGAVAEAFGGQIFCYANKSSTSYPVAIKDLVDEISAKGCWIDGI